MNDKLIKPNNFTPDQIINYGQDAARKLNELVIKAGWVTKIGNNNYLQFEAWQTVARFYGMSARTVSTTFVQYDQAKGFEARAEVVDKDGQIIGAAEALCLDDEKNWKGKPLYALKSMSQTRACGKALRQILSWVVVLAGYKPAPAEEMSEEIIANPSKETPQGDHFCTLHNKALKDRGKGVWDHRMKNKDGMWEWCQGKGYHTSVNQS